MTEKQYNKFCRACKSDLLSDFGEEADNSSYYYDMAEGIIMTDPDIRQYLRKLRVEQRAWKDRLAEDIASADIP